MPQREPAGVRFETRVDRQIRQAAERGEFKDPPGSGAPLPGLGKPYDEMWWVKRKLRHEGLSYLPPSLALRKEVHDVVEGAARARTEAEVRDRVDAINESRRHQREDPLGDPGRDPRSRGQPGSGRRGARAEGVAARTSPRGSEGIGQRLRGRVLA
jgi:hypothetical protein